MRKIKFRLYDKETDSVEGVDALPMAISELDMDDWGKFIFMQFVGVYDINGKEIYEDDIVKSIDGQIGKVFWDEYKFEVDGYYDSGADYPNIAFSEGVFEVIGNVYENPELIKEQD